MSLTAISLLESARKKFFTTRRTSCLESRNQAGRNESNSHQAQQTEMSLRAISSLESARRKFFINSTYIMSRKEELSRPK